MFNCLIKTYYIVTVIAWFLKSSTYFSSNVVFTENKNATIWHLDQSPGSAKPRCLGHEGQAVLLGDGDQGVGHRLFRPPEDGQGGRSQVKQATQHFLIGQEINV